MIKRGIGLFLAFLAWTAPAAEPIVAGKARFSFLTDRMVRMEYAPDGKFEDRASLTFVDRTSTAGELRVRREGGGCTVESAALKLVYGGGEFSPATLTIELKRFAKDGRNVVWHYGDDDTGNLYGTTRTLDAVGGFAALFARMEPGILSRDGWAVVDDSESHLFVPTAGHWRNWVATRPDVAGRRDLVFFGYGHDYPGALADYTRVAGKIPLPPRYAFGYWSSRYWPYSDDEIEDIIALTKDYGIPMDVFVIDMDWHETWGLPWGGKDEFGNPHGWTGYTWNRRLFANPEATLKDLHDAGLKVALNLHPAGGIEPMEDCYDRCAAAYGWKYAAERRAIPFRISEEKWADMWFDRVLKPIEAQGCDFWWMDWQQWLISKYVPGLSVTFWLNYTMDRHESEKRDAEGRALRPLIYHRWGGMGSHRYQMGFSGDTLIRWESLRMLPWFTATSGNVGYGYWGHDIGGHMAPGDLGNEPELFLRWMQSGVFTPLFKIHSSRDPRIGRTLWNYPRHFPMMREAIRLRYRLAPYIYTAARHAYDTGVSICRPLYWDDPEDDESYTPYLPELKFGPDIVAVTVGEHTDPTTGLAKAMFRLPPGRWYDAARGEVLAGATTWRREYAIDENPHFIKAGAVIPLYPDSVKNLGAARNTAIDLLVAPGAAAGAGELYEDDGVHADYAERFSRVKFEMTARDKTLKVKISPREGEFAGMPSTRVWRVVLPNRFPPKSASFDGRPVDWRYDGRLPGVVATAPVTSAAAGAEFAFEFGEPVAAGETALDGVRAVANRARILAEEIKMQVGDGFPAAPVWDFYQNLTCAGSRLSHYPETAAATVAQLRRDLAEFRRRFLDGGEPRDDSLRAKIRAQLYPAASLPLPAANVKLESAKAECVLDASGKPLTIVSWRVERLEPGSLQAGYRVTVATDKGEPVWDSNWRYSANGFAIVRRDLPPGSSYVWNLQLMDDRGRVTAATVGRFEPSPAPDASRRPAVVGEGYGFVKSIWRRWRASGDLLEVARNWEALEAAADRAGVSSESFNDDIRAIRAAWLMKEMSEAVPGLAPVDKYYKREMEARRRFALHHQNDDGTLKAGADGAAEILMTLKARCIDNSAAKAKTVEKLRAAVAKDGVPPAAGRFEPEETFTVMTDDAGLGDMTWRAIRSGAFDPALRNAAEQWKLEYGAGIREWWSSTGYAIFTLGPEFDAAERSIRRSYAAPMGTIESDWQSLGDGKFKWHYVIPAGSTAMVRLPDGSCTATAPGEYTVEVRK